MPPRRRDIFALQMRYVGRRPTRYVRVADEMSGGEEMKRIISVIIALVFVLSAVVVGVSAEDVKEEKIIFEYDIYDNTKFGYDYVYAGIFAEYSRVNKVWTLEDFPGVKAYSVKDTQARSGNTVTPKGFHQILKFKLIDNTADGCLEAIRALEASEYVKSANPQVHSGWDPVPSYPVDPFADGYPAGNITEIGDANEDGSIDAKDVLLLRRVIVGLETLEFVFFADVTCDGYVTAKDVLLLRRMIVGLA